ncbi:MAG: GNAT family N-acetyltransferase [Marinibacterium sp.]|nr:GNAT family N-acetyltransferase [Marinibacterium sp.]
MSAAIHLAGPDDLPKLLALVTAFHGEEGISQSDDQRMGGIEPLVQGIPHGAAYLLGPKRAPMGYIIVCFSWSVEFGGLDATIDEIYLRPPVRGRGIATEALISIAKALRDAGVVALHLEVDTRNEAAQRLYTRAGFRLRDRYQMMTRVL